MTHDHQTESTFVRKEPCPECGSRDNLARYSDGHAHCFGCGHYEKGDGQAAVSAETTTRRSSDLIPFGAVTEWVSRKITKATCQKYGVSIGSTAKGQARILPYRSPDGSTVVAQKVRPASKDDTFATGDLKASGLFGQHLFREGGKRLVITEGEIDAMSVSQAFNNSWPAVSIKRGAKAARRDIQEQLSWVSSFDEIVLMFDSDEQGRAAVADCVTLFAPGKVKVANLSYKDANEALMAGDTKAISEAVFQAQVYRPDGIVTVADIFDLATKDIETERPWFIDTMTAWTFGRRRGELYGFGAGTGVGKTDLFSQQIAYDVGTLNLPVGIFFLEQHPAETVQRLAGKLNGKPFHVPDGSWTHDERTAAIASLRDMERVHLYHHFGQTDWDVLRSRMEFMHHQSGVIHFYVDHLTALADPSNERESLETIMEEMASLAQRLGLVIHYISHLSTPEKGSHEEGAHVSLRHFKGARAIGFWTHYAFGLERDKTAEIEAERLVTTLRCIKDRFTGRADGKTLLLRYDHASTLLHETLTKQGAANYGFTNEEDAAPVL